MVTLTCDITRGLRSVQHRADGRHGRIDALRDLPVGAFERARARGGLVEFGSEPGTVGAERMELARHPRLAAIGLTPAIDRSLESIERVSQSPACRLDRIDVAHFPFRIHKNSCNRRDFTKRTLRPWHRSVNVSATVRVETCA